MPRARGPILVVEDDEDVSEALRDTLAEAGYETAAVMDGQDAIEYLRSHPAPPLILLDWNMARMNGPQLMAEVAKEPSLSSVPIVLMTADTRVADKVRALGRVRYLKKPVDLNALFEVVGEYCGD